MEQSFSLPELQNARTLTYTFDLKYQILHLIIQFSKNALNIVFVYLCSERTKVTDLLSDFFLILHKNSPIEICQISQR